MKYTFAKFTFALLITLLLTPQVAMHAADKSRSKPNVIVVLADDLGYGDLGCYGSKISATPNIDALAKGGLRFTDFHSAGAMCSPTRASILTGRYPQRFGRMFDSALSGTTQRDLGLPLEATTIAELLRKNGYATGCFGKWHLGYQMPLLPTRQGFDVFRGLVSGDGDFHTHIDRSGNRDWWHNDRIEMAEGYTTDLLTKYSVDFIKEHPEERFFLYLPHLAIHFPWQGPDDPPHRTVSKSWHKDKWGVIPDRGNVGPHVKAMIESLDASVGAIVGALRKWSLENDTVFVFTSDNGGYLTYGKDFRNISSNGPWRGQKTELYEGGHRVPLIVSWPGRIPPGVTDEAAHSNDLFPTLLGLSGTAQVESDGVDLAPLWIGREPLPQRDLFWRTTSHRAVRSGPWKLVMPLRRGAKPELYQLGNDPGETTNLSVMEPQRVKTLQLAWQGWNAQMAMPEEKPDDAIMLAGDWVPEDPHQIDYEKLPRVKAEHAIISDVRDHAGTRVHQHAYLAHHDDRFWAMWSDGPGGPRAGVTPKQHRNIVPAHDMPGTRNSFATSNDGLHWSKPADLTGPPRKKGYGWISRGLWKRDGELLALSSHFNAPGYAGLGLSLETFRWNGTKWVAHGTVLDDSMNNFPPKRLPSGEWMMTRRDHQRQVSVMIGGTKAFNDWRINPLAAYDGNGRPEEPYWYILPDGKTIVGLIRDNGRSKFLLRTFSRDNGKTWSPIHQTNFPDATSKFFVHRTSRGYYVMVSNSNPRKRDPLTLAISEDGLVYTKLFWLVGGRHVDYPHIIEHDGHLLIAFSGAKQTMEVMKVSLDELELLAMPESVQLANLSNKDGLPAGTFRSDIWPLQTQARVTTPLVLTEGGTPEEPAVFDGQGMLIDLGIDVSNHEWSKSGDLWTSQPRLLASHSQEPRIAGQTAGLFVDGIPITIPRDLEAEKQHPDRKSRCYYPPDGLQPGQMGYAEDGSLYFRWPKGVPHNKPITLPPKAGTNCVSIACSHIIIRNITAMHAGNDGFNIHGHRKGIRLENVRALSNADEGISAHETVEMEVVGAEVAWNGSEAGGVADVNDSITSYCNCIVHDNAGAGFYFSGKSHAVTDTLIFSQSKDFSIQRGTPLKRDRIKWLDSKWRLFSE